MTSIVLIVEDDQTIRDSLVELLESEGYQTWVAENGKQAIDLLTLSATLPGLVLLDLMMPVMDGIEFSRIKSQNARLAPIPVVVMSADGQIKEKAQRAGANGFLKKPANIEDIIAAVGKYCA